MADEQKKQEPRPAAKSLRDEFAMNVAAGFAQRWASREPDVIAQHCELAYVWADAMLLAREKDHGQAAREAAAELERRRAETATMRPPGSARVPAA